MSKQSLLNDLAKAKTIFQLRSILTVMEVPEVHCGICGDYHPADAIPFTCETGDGV